eukprot:TRINITY_DN6328_c1_g1_i1.p1 TRINITY_DN6328_c1_g1~~TRINITY_DN6328_c1_g1_i1.p1  ORF type:complete len:102 (+),score=5.96 TRINITY_DN6328_c1_g1_i1:19-324(+)
MWKCQGRRRCTRRRGVLLVYTEGEVSGGEELQELGLHGPCGGRHEKRSVAGTKGFLWVPPPVVSPSHPSQKLFPLITSCQGCGKLEAIEFDDQSFFYWSSD